MSKSTAKFSKTLSLPVVTWAKLEEVRSLTRMPDLAVALQECIDSKHESLSLIQKMAEKDELEIVKNRSNSD